MSVSFDVWFAPWRDAGLSEETLTTVCFTAVVETWVSFDTILASLPFTGVLEVLRRFVSFGGGLRTVEEASSLASRDLFLALCLPVVDGMTDLAFLRSFRREHRNPSMKEIIS